MKLLKVLLVTTIMVMSFAMLGLSQEAFASPRAADAPSLGAAGSFSVLGFSAVTNSGPTTLSGDIGVWSGSEINGLSDITVGGSVHQTDGVAQQAQADANTAIGSMSSQAATSPILGALDSVTLNPGVYDIGAGSLGGGVLTLDGEGVYIFRASSSLTSSGSVTLIGGARACDVYWFVPTLASLTGGSFVGTIIAGTITFGTGVSLDGRALAITNNVTLLSNRITGPSCAAPVAQEESTAVAGVSGLPASGGAPLRNEILPLGLAVLFGGLSIVVSVLIVRALRRNYRQKQ